MTDLILTLLPAAICYGIVRHEINEPAEGNRRTDFQVPWTQPTVETLRGDAR